MKFEITEDGRKLLRKRLVNEVIPFVSEEDQGLLITTTNANELIEKNVIQILKTLLGENKSVE